MIVSRSIPALDEREDGIWWNPAGMSLEEAIRAVLPEGGQVAVPEGQDVFDLIGPRRFTTFHLACALGQRLLGGRGLFATCQRGVPAEDVLTRGGLVPGAPVWLDQPTRVNLIVWRRA